MWNVHIFRLAIDTNNKKSQWDEMYFGGALIFEFTVFSSDFLDSFNDYATVQVY